jgi:hypothetical protein
MAVLGGEGREWIAGGGLPLCQGGGERRIVEGATEGDVIGCAQQWFGGSGAGEGSHLRGLL